MVLAAAQPENPDQPGEGSPSLLESGGYLALTPREGVPDFNVSFILEYDAELGEYTLRYPSPGTPQNVAAGGAGARRLLDDCARFYTIEYIPD